MVDHNTNSHSNFAENEIRRFAGNGQNSEEIDSGSDINRLSGELNPRITQEMNGLMNSVSLQIQRAISEVINEQVLPQIQVSLRSGSGQMPQKGWNVLTERLEYSSEGTFNRKVRSSSRDEILRILTHEEDPHYSYIFRVIIYHNGNKIYSFDHRLLFE